MSKKRGYGNTGHVLVDYQIEGTSELQYRRGEKEYHFPLREVDEEEVLRLRCDGKPGFILKVGPKIFYTEIRNDMHPYNIQEYERHQCDNCAKCRALSDDLGGCQKVRDVTDDSILDRKARISSSKRLEKYDFVNIGYEAFNCNVEVLGIVDCMNFHRAQKAKTMDLSALNELKYSIEELYGELFREEVVSNMDFL